MFHTLVAVIFRSQSMATPSERWYAIPRYLSTSGSSPYAINAGPAAFTIHKRQQQSSSEAPSATNSKKNSLTQFLKRFFAIAITSPPLLSISILFMPRHFGSVLSCKLGSSHQAPKPLHSTLCQHRTIQKYSSGYTTPGVRTVSSQWL